MIPVIFNFFFMRQVLSISLYSTLLPFNLIRLIQHNGAYDAILTPTLIRKKRPFAKQLIAIFTKVAPHSLNHFRTQKT